jgi:hypothetical protein
VLNGEEWRGWFRSRALDVEPGPRVGRLRLDLEDGRVVLDFAPAPGRRLGTLDAHLALLGFGIETAVEAGENEGRRLQLSLPLTPRRDAMPRGVQVKGARRWAHSKQTTLNLADGTNALRPFMLYEPLMDLDLRRDFLDSGRLGPAWLREQLPRMREAWLLWGS